MKSIKVVPVVSAGSVPVEYKVITVKNSVEYSPGDIVSRKEISSLCENKRWDVTIVPPLA